MKNYIKIGLLFITLVITFCGCSEEEPAELPAAPEEEIIESVTIGNMGDKNNTDVVLVMDKSGSMATADPRRFAIEGAKLFIDMEKLSGVNVALVEFSDKVKSTGLIEIKQQQNKDYLKAVLDDISYAGKAHTDTGAGMLEAVSVLDQSGNDNKKAIILFTDGRTDIDPDTDGRTVEDALNDTNEAVRMAAEKGYTIYCIGLNSDGRVDEKELAGMAASTNGKYHIASNVDELRDFFSSIFTEIDNTEEEPVDEYVADGSYHDSVFTIDNPDIAEANIIILSSRQVEDCILIDNNENRVDLEKGENVIFSSSATYALIKLINPAQGDWTIRVRGITDDQIRIGLIYNFDLSLIVEADRTSVIKGDSVNIKAFLAKEGRVITQSNLYQQMKGTVSFTNRETGKENHGELSLNESGNAFEGEITPSEPSEYDVSVHLQGRGLFRDSDTFTITVIKEPVRQIRVLGEQKVRINETKTIDLNEYFEYASAYSVESQDEAVDVQIQHSILRITGRNAGEAVVFIYADNGSAEKAACEMKVRCITLWEEYRYAVILTGILILLLILILFANRKKKIGGTFRISISSVQKDVNGIMQRQSFEILNAIPVSAFGRKGFSADKLLKASQGYYDAMEYDRRKKEAFTQCINEVLAEARKIRFTGSREPDRFKIRKSSNRVQFLDKGHITESKVLTVHIDNQSSWGGRIGEREIGIRFQYDEERYTQIDIVYK